MLSFTYLFINFTVTAIVLFLVLVLEDVQDGLGYKEIMMNVKRMRREFLVTCVWIFLIQAISWFATKGILG